MAAYIVGLIAGTICTVFPLVYLMNFDKCLADILMMQPDFDTNRFNPSASAVASSIIAIGAVILLLSAAMIALTGLRRLRTLGAPPQSEPPPGALES